MSRQPEALRLADILQHRFPSVECLEKAAAELRRLHAECDALRAMADDVQRWHDQQLDRADKAEAECDALRADAERWKGLFAEALDAFNSRRPTDIEWSAMRDMAREARAALKETK